MKNIIKHLVTSSILILLSGCGPGGDEGVVGTGLTSTRVIKGSALKGPYLTGSQVLLSRLLADGTPSPETTRTEIEDDLGNFRYSVTQPGPVQFSADGVHFNEITGKPSNGRLVLNAIYNVTEDPVQRSYINVLTHIAYKRTLKLFREGIPITDAIAQAESETLSSLSLILPATGVNHFTDLNVFDNDESQARGNAYVLAWSSLITLYAMNQITTDAHKDETLDSYLTYFLNGLADDLAKDGQIDLLSTPGLVSDLKITIHQLQPDAIKKNLEERGFLTRNEKLPVANLDLFIDTDGDGVTNSEDPDDDNDGIPDEQDASPYVYSETPVLIKPDVNTTLPINTEILFEWSTSEYSSRVEYQLSKNNSFSTLLTTDVITGKSFSGTFDRASVMYLRLRSQSSSGEWAPWGNTFTLNIAVFERHISGALRDVTQKISITKTGALYLLAINREKVSSLYKFDQYGNPLWNYVLNSNYYDLITLSDDSALVVGSTIKKNSLTQLNGNAIKATNISGDGQFISDNIFQKAGYNNSSSNGAVLAKGNVYIQSYSTDCYLAAIDCKTITIQEDPLGCKPNIGPCSITFNSTIEQLNLKDGSMSEIAIISDIPNYRGSGAITTTSDGELLTSYSLFIPNCFNVARLPCRSTGFSDISTKGIIQWNAAVPFLSNGQPAMPHASAMDLPIPLRLSTGKYALIGGCMTACTTIFNTNQEYIDNYSIDQVLVYENPTVLSDRGTIFRVVQNSQSITENGAITETSEDGITTNQFNFKGLGLALLKTPDQGLIVLLTRNSSVYTESLYLVKIPVPDYK